MGVYGGGVGKGPLQLDQSARCSACEITWNILHVEKPVKFKLRVRQSTSHLHAPLKTGSGDLDDYLQ